MKQKKDNQLKSHSSSSLNDHIGNPDISPMKKVKGVILFVLESIQLIRTRNWLVKLWKQKGG